MQRSATARWIDRLAQVFIGATALLAACVALTGVGPRSQAETPAGRYRAAMETYEAKMWPEAYAQLSSLADAGDPSAARVAAMMARQGPLLFGQRFEVTPERLARWDRATRGSGAAGPDASAGKAAAGVATSRETGASTGDSRPGVQVARAR